MFHHEKAIFVSRIYELESVTVEQKRLGIDRWALLKSSTVPGMYRNTVPASMSGPLFLYDRYT